MARFLIILIGFVMLTGCEGSKPLFYGENKAAKQLYKAKYFFPELYAETCENNFVRNDSIARDSFYLPGETILILDTVYTDSGKTRIIYVDRLRTDTVRKNVYVQMNNPATEAKYKARIAAIEVEKNKVNADLQKAKATIDAKEKNIKYWKKLFYKALGGVIGLSVLIAIFIVVKVKTGGIGGIMGIFSKLGK